MPDAIHAFQHGGLRPGAFGHRWQASLVHEFRQHWRLAVRPPRRPARRGIIHSTRDDGWVREIDESGILPGVLNDRQFRRRRWRSRGAHIRPKRRRRQVKQRGETQRRCHESSGGSQQALRHRVRGQAPETKSRAAETQRSSPRACQSTVATRTSARPPHALPHHPPHCASLSRWRRRARHPPAR